MTDTYPVTVIIPAYNAERTIQRAIESAWEAKAQQVIIVDDVSTDATYRQVIEKYKVRPWFWNYSTVVHSGVCCARNLGLIHSHEELILCLDADDYLFPDAIQRLYEAWHPSTWVYGGHQEIDENGNVLRDVTAPSPYTLAYKNVTNATFLFHRDDWQKVGGYDPDFEIGGEDYAFQVALTSAGVKPVRLTGAPLYQRTVRAGGRTARAVKYWNIIHELALEKYPLPKVVG